ncbi:MAG: SAM-dependent methyltransferase [Vicinamibacterales bacterium]|nr:SAM-dependent methyltransferase [Vicinamibacterales bacterium]
MNPLRQLISERIRESGPISFAEFMDLSLYQPEFGYYARAAQRTGRAGDFFTSVDVGAVFGELLAKQIAEMLRLIGPKAQSPKPEAVDLVEAGSGNGRLSKDVLDALQRTDPDLYASIRLSLVERSAAARSAQRATLGDHASHLVHSSAELPEHVYGVIFANELLDAFPTHAVTMTDAGLREIFVDERDGQFVEYLETLSTPRISDYLSRAGAKMHQGWRAEVNLAAEDWVGTAARSLEKGFMMVIDYGHSAEELYGASHSAGTLTTFKSHTTFAEVLQTPGDCDITAHVDLTAVTRAGEQAGLESLGRLDQTYFMLGLGLDEMMALDQSFEPSAMQRRLALKTLLLPGGLGSTHKVLLFGKDVGKPTLKGLSYRIRVT